MPASVDASHQNRSLGDEQLDDSIVDTLVSALLLMSAYHISSYLQAEPFRTLRMGAKNTANLREFGLLWAISDRNKRVVVFFPSRQTVPVWRGWSADIPRPSDEYALRAG
jgi:hypothetical protein